MEVNAFILSVYENKHRFTIDLHGAIFNENNEFMEKKVFSFPFFKTLYFILDETIDFNEQLQFQIINEMSLILKDSASNIKIEKNIKLNTMECSSYKLNGYEKIISLTFRVKSDSNLYYLNNLKILKVFKVFKHIFYNEATFLDAFILHHKLKGPSWVKLLISDSNNNLIHGLKVIEKDEFKLKYNISENNKLFFLPNIKMKLMGLNYINVSEKYKIYVKIFNLKLNETDGCHSNNIDFEHYEACEVVDNSLDATLNSFFELLIKVNPDVVFGYDIINNLMNKLKKFEKYKQHNNILERSIIVDTLTFGNEYLPKMRNNSIFNMVKFIKSKNHKIPSSLNNYEIIDSQIQLIIEQGWLLLTFILSKESSLPWNLLTISKKSKQYLYYLNYAFHSNNFILPDYISNHKYLEQSKIKKINNKKGGTNLDPKPGIYKSYSSEIDGIALYSFCVLESGVCFSLDPSKTILPSITKNLIDKKVDIEELIKKKKNTSTHRDTNVMIISESNLEEEEEKKEKEEEEREGGDDNHNFFSSKMALDTLDCFRRAIKILLNSGLGCIGMESFPYFSERVYNAITSVGRKFISTAQNIVEKSSYNTKVLFGVTDSICINLEGCMEGCEEEVINEIIKDIESCFTFLKVKKAFEFKLIFVPQIKNTYAGLSISDDNTMLIKGFGQNNSKKTCDYIENYTKYFIQDLLILLLKNTSQEEVKQYIQFKIDLLKTILDENQNLDYTQFEMYNKMNSKIKPSIFFIRYKKKTEEFHGFLYVKNLHIIDSEGEFNIDNTPIPISLFNEENKTWSKFKISTLKFDLDTTFYHKQFLSLIDPIVNFFEITKKRGREETETISLKTKKQKTYNPFTDYSQFLEYVDSYDEDKFYNN
jgi:DNA polymerase elongation subunit (family B)